MTRVTLQGSVDRLKARLTQIINQTVYDLIVSKWTPRRPEI